MESFVAVVIARTLDISFLVAALIVAVGGTSRGIPFAAVSSALASETLLVLLKSSPFSEYTWGSGFHVAFLAGLLQASIAWWVIAFIRARRNKRLSR